MEKLRERVCRLLKQIHERAKGSTARIIDALQAGRETAKPMTRFEERNVPMSSSKTNLSEATDSISGVIHIGKRGRSRETRISR
jgi:hypothetical protein